MLEVENVHSFYGEAYVLRGVSMKMPQGGVVALLGRNGMGKTTLIRSIMGLTPPSVRDGQIRYRGEAIRGRPPHEIARRGIGLVPQGRRLFSSLSVIEHLTLLSSGKLRGAGANNWTLERVFALFPQLAERRQHRGNQLSGGERQMLAIARALMTDPELLLMDEPSEGLAPVMVRHLEGIIMALKQAGLSILLVEQNLHSALVLADEIYILENGQFVFHGAPEQLKQNKSAMHRHLGV